MNLPDDERQCGEEPELSDEQLLAWFLQFRDRLEVARDDSDEMLRVSEEMGEFLQKHHERLTDAGFCTEEHLAELGRNLERLREAQSASDKANEEYIQATANLAEHEQGLIEKIFEAVHMIHAGWDELDFAAREQFSEILDTYMDNREDYLSRLPIESRRKLEAKFPKWW